MIVQRTLQAKLQYNKADHFPALTWDEKHLQGLGNQEGLSSLGGVVVFKGKYCVLLCCVCQ